MRILYHHRTLADGAEGIHIAEMVKAFRTLGHDVHVCGLAGAEGSPARHGLVDGLKRTLPSAAFEIASVSSNVLDYVAVRRAIRATGADFLYKRHARLDVGALSAAQHAGIPTVLEVNCLFAGHNYEQFEPIVLDGLAARLERHALTLADVVIAVSTPLAQDVACLAGVDAAVLPNGADPKRFDFGTADPVRIRSHLGLCGAVTVGWAGVMRDWHGIELLLDAVSRVPDLRLLIVGGGPARAAVERHANAVGVADRMVITGRIPQEQMPDYLAAMDIAVVASDRTRVASPMKLLEYMAMERAVVAPRLANIKDLVTDGRDGLLFSPEDADDLAETLRRLAQNEPLRTTLGREARRTVQERHNWHRNAKRVLALVKSRISKGPSEQVASCRPAS